jgi:hypothetical protein
MLADCNISLLSLREFYTISAVLAPGLRYKEIE